MTGSNCLRLFRTAQPPTWHWIPLLGLGLILQSNSLLSAQVLELSGGTSSLYQAQGASLVMRTPVSETTFSAGMLNGHFLAGAALTHHTERSTYSAGMQEISLDLPTDLTGGHRLHAVGVGIRTLRSHQEGPPDDLEVFAGATSSWLSTPLFNGVRPDSPSGALLLHHALSQTLEMTSQIVYASRLTMLQSARWRPKPQFTLAATAGSSGGAHYLAGTLELKRSLLELRAGYVAAGANFMRAGLESDVVAEPVREHIDLILRSSHAPRVTAEISRENFLTPNVQLTGLRSGPTLTSTTDDLNVSTHLRHAGFEASMLHSTFAQQHTLAFDLAGSCPLPWKLIGRASYLESQVLGSASALANHTVITSVGRQVSSRLTANGTVTWSNGKPSLAMGGSLLSNWLTLSADVQTFYVPTNPTHPFQQTLIISTELNLFGRLRLLASSFVSPSGKLLYTAEAHGLASHLAPSVRPAPQQKFEEFVLHARVLDENAQPVSGAALDVDGAAVFTDSEGRFFLRERKERRHILKVLTDEFLDGHLYRVMQTPPVLTSHRHGTVSKENPSVQTEDAAEPPEVNILVSRSEGEHSSAPRPTNGAPQ